MIIAGIGAGGVYGTCVGNALKWFPDKRGLAAGITAAGFGAGSALTVAPIQAMIKDSGFQTTFLYFGLGQGIIICILAFFCSRRRPARCRTWWRMRTCCRPAATISRPRFCVSRSSG